MMRIFAISIAALTLSIATSADVTGKDGPSAEAMSSEVGPLRNMYDTVLINSEQGKVLTPSQAADELNRFDVVFFGEFHGHPGNHLAQMQLFQALHERNPDITLSLEQFERDTQPVVDRYLADEIGEKVLTEDGRGWPNYEQSYRPLVEYAKLNELPVIASNAPRNIVICVGKKGTEILDRVPQPDRGWVAAELHVDEGNYLDKYLAFVASSSTHGPGKKDAEDGQPDQDAGPPEIPEEMLPMAMRSFSAQVTRDDTMAESIARHLQANPGRKVLHLNGHFHSASHLGTVERLKMRMPKLAIAVINPIDVEDANAPAWTAEDAATGDYLLLIQALPEMFISEERELEYEMSIIKKRMGNTCEYAEAPKARYF